MWDFEMGRDGGGDCKEACRLVRVVVSQNQTVGTIDRGFPVIADDTFSKYSSETRSGT